MQQLIRCQIARSVHYTSTRIIVRLPEEANNQAQSLLVLVLLLQSIEANSQAQSLLVLVPTIVYRGMYYTSTRKQMEECLHSYYNFKM